MIIRYDTFSDGIADIAVSDRGKRKTLNQTILLLCQAYLWEHKLTCLVCYPNDRKGIKIPNMPSEPILLQYRLGDIMMDSINGGLNPAAEVEFAEQVLNVNFNGGFSKVEVACNNFIAVSCCKVT